MKKIIALAIAGAFAAPAMAADITISGDVEYKFTTQNSATTGTTGDADFFITATEELGNGISVKAYVGYDTDTTSAAVANRESKMELTGSFGKIEIGNDAGEAIGEYDEVADVAPAGAGSTLNDGHSTGNSVVWHLPTGVEGLNAAVSYGAGASGNTEATSMAAQYTFSGVTVAYGMIDEEDAAYNPSVLSLSTKVGPFYLAYEKVDNQMVDLDGDANAAEGDTLTAIGITYDYGQGKLFMEQNKFEDLSATTYDETSVAYGATYNLGSTVNFYVAVEDRKENNVEDDTSTTIGVTYAF